MKTGANISWLPGAALFLIGLLSGCADTGSTSVHGSVSYGVGYYSDPWYYGPGYCPPAVVVTPPPNRPGPPPRPAHPIARPPAAAPRPMAAPRGGRR